MKYRYLTSLVAAAIFVIGVGNANANAASNINISISGANIAAIDRNVAITRINQIESRIILGKIANYGINLASSEIEMAGTIQRDDIEVDIANRIDSAISRIQLARPDIDALIADNRIEAAVRPIIS